MSFKAKQIGVVLAGCLLAGAAHAQGGQYAKIQLGIADADGYSDDGLALMGTFGLELPQVVPNFSVEGELTASIDDPEWSFAGNSVEYSYYTLGGYGVYTLPVNPSFDLYGRAGIVYSDWTVEGPFWEESDSDLDLSFGIGANVAMGSTVDFTAGITVMNEDLTHFSAGAQFRF